MIKPLVAVAASALLLSATGCGTDADPNITSSSKGAGKKGAGKKGDLNTVVYTVAGTAKKGGITYQTPSGQEQDNGAKLPWTKTFKAKDFEFVSVNAQNEGTGNITCEIKVNGKAIKRGTSKGQFALVSCDAMLGS